MKRTFKFYKSLFTLTILLFSFFSVNAQYHKLLKVKKIGESNLVEKKIRKINKLTSKNNTNQALKVWLSDAYLQKGDYESALPFLKEIVDFNNISEQYNYKLAQAYLFFNQQDEAINQLKYAGLLGVNQVNILNGSKFILPSNAAISPLISINTKKDEVSKGFYNGKIIFSASKARKLKLLENKDIFFSTLMSKGTVVENIYPFSNNRRLRDDISIASYEKGIVLNKSNKRRFFKIEKPTSGLYFITDNVKKVEPFKFNSLAYNIINPFLANDGKTIYFSSNMMGGKGGYDLYVCYKHAGGWSYPQNLGNTVNTSMDELYPCIVDSILYFSSDGLPGFGNMDIYSSKMIGDKFEVPQNMGTPINSSANDIGFYIEINRKTAVMTSDRQQGQGGKDLYFIKFE